MKEISFTDRVKNEIKKHIIDGEKIDTKTIDKVKARKLLRKKFVSCGEVNDPTKDTHLEYLVKSAKEANEIISYLDYMDIVAKLSMRKKSFAVYIKDQSNIIRLLDILGAKKLSKEYDEIKSKKSISGYINRLTNFETANITRSTMASIKQCDDIDRLLKKKKISMLDEGLQDVIRARKRYKELSTSELATRLKISKSCLIHRLDKIHKLASI